MMREALIEKAAKALYEANWGDDFTFQEDRDYWMGQARAVLAVFEEHASDLATSPELPREDAGSLHVSEPHSPSLRVSEASVSVTDDEVNSDDERGGTDPRQRAEYLAASRAEAALANPLARPEPGAVQGDRRDERRRQKLARGIASEMKAPAVGHVHQRLAEAVLTWLDDEKADFRRTARGEPSNASDPEKSDIPGGEMSLSGHSVQGEPTQEERDAGLSEAHSESYRLGWRDGRASVQGEPTDAEVQAFVTAINAEGFVLDRRAVKAGLRAAAEGTGQPANHENGRHI